MTLGAFLEQQQMTQEAFAEMVGASAWGVGKWVRGERVPRREQMRRIQEATRGAVTASDFFAEPAQPEGV